MARGWTGKHQFQKFQGELAVRTGEDFERYVLHFLHLIWPTAIGTPRRRKFDQKGADHLVWTDSPPFPVIVQCKGWEVPEEQLGSDQVRQCLTSIEAFQASGLIAETYLLVHNRLGAAKQFRQPITERLEELKSSGQVQQAELWSRQKLVQEAFEAFRSRCLSEITRRNLNSFRIFRESEQVRWEPLEAVPLQSGFLVANQYQRVDAELDSPKVADPYEELLSTGVSISLLVGEADFGKSITAFRIVESARHQVIYVPAAMITKAAVNTYDFLKQAISVEELLTDSLPEDIPVHKNIAYTVLPLILQTENSNLLLVIDGIDESIYFNRRGGIQELLNIIGNTVLERDPHQVNRAQLFREWAYQKIWRDICNPKLFHGQRVPIVAEDEDAQTTIELAFLAMTKAATLMTEVEDGIVEMVPTCALDDLIDSHPRLKQIREPTGIVLNSLLVPARTPLGESSRIGFAHRAFQEYFLAQAIHTQSVEFGSATIPDTVQEWLDALAAISTGVEEHPSSPPEVRRRASPETSKHEDTVPALATVFLSYAREDVEKVTELRQKLSDVGFKPWMDKEDILPGEIWERSIQHAIRDSDFFLVCLSQHAVNKRGFLQREIKVALEMWQEKLESDIYLIPVRLESCDVPDSLCQFQWVDLFEADGWTRLVRAVQTGIQRRSQ